MDRKDLAKKIREEIFNRAEEDGRVMHASSMDEIIEQVLTKYDSRPMWLAPPQPKINSTHPK
jgi:hypothetical protein